jgi:protein SCO1/2
MSRFLKSFGIRTFATRHKFSPKQVHSPISWKSLAVTFSFAGLGLYFLNEERKRTLERIEKDKVDKAIISYGKPDIGGPFSLIECSTGNAVTQEDFKGKFMIIYFGFTHW